MTHYLPLTISRNTHPPNQFRNQLTPHSPFEHITSSTGRSLRWFLTRGPHWTSILQTRAQVRGGSGGEKCFYTFETPSSVTCRVLTFHPAFESPFAVPKLITVGTSTPSEEIETSLNHPRTCVVKVIIISNNGALFFFRIRRWCFFRSAKHPPAWSQTW